MEHVFICGQLINYRGEIKSHLLCSRYRVTPVQKVTLPRLELCGAVLLAELVDKILCRRI
jgi:hypothetical protein